MPTNTRKNHTAFTDEERTRFLDAVVELKATRSTRPHEGNPEGSVYGDFVAVHIDAFWNGAAHGTSNFLPWHRQFVLEFEIALNATSAARGGPRICVPYWDWTVNREPDATPWTEQWLGDNGTGLLRQVQRGRFGVPDSDLDQVLSEATMTRLRAAGGIGGLTPEEKSAVWTEVEQRLAQLPEDRWRVVRVVDYRPFLTRDFDLPLAPFLPFWERESEESKQRRREREGEDFRDRGLGVLDAVDESSYNAFRPRFEVDQHGAVHAELGGNMGGSGSPNDPAFWLHHCFVDKIWADWQAKQAERHPTAEPYLPLAASGQDPGYQDRFGPWNTMSAADLIDTARIRHPAQGEVGYVYR